MKTKTATATQEEIVVPEEFPKIIQDFVSDLVITFPEYEPIIQKWWPSKDINKLFKHCLKVFPERFFDILYKNADIFGDDSEVSTEFLPGIVFQQLWSCDISENTRETIWKYLQLILFTVVGNVNDATDFGDNAKLFESIDQEELKTKLQETFENMQKMFEASSSSSSSSQTENGTREGGINMDNMPNAEDIHSHINNMMHGKLGKLAMELAEETAKDLHIDMQNVSSAQDVIQQLFKNPTKLMNMVKNVGGKLEDRMKSGEISETELLSESMDILNRMKTMPGMQNMQQMFSQMGLGKGAKMDMNAMESEINRRMKTAQTKERMRANLHKKQQQQQQQQQQQGREEGQNQQKQSSVQQDQQPVLSDEQLISMFESNPAASTTTGKKSKKSKK